MKILLTGANGQIGYEVQRQAIAAGHEILTLGREQLDITIAEQIEQNFVHWQPEIVINAAAYTAVDRAEQEVEQAYLINATGPRLLAQACARLNIPFIHLSTDYVFSGNQNFPYRETDTVAPLNTYGLSKLAGEIHVRQNWHKHIILRVSGVFGIHGHNFVKTMIRLCQQQNSLRIVADQITCPTAALDIANALLVIAEQVVHSPSNADWGTYHFCSADAVSWYEFANAIIQFTVQHLALPQREVLAISAADYPTPAQRPAYSVLDCHKFQEQFPFEPRSWRESLPTLIPTLLAQATNG